MKRRSFIKASLGSIILRDQFLSVSQSTTPIISNNTKPEDFTKILDGLWLIRDTCNVYLIKDHDRAIAIDFGSGQWLRKLDQLGISSLDHVFLTHHHRDQCHGLENETSLDFPIHAPAGEEVFLDPDIRKKEIDTNRFGQGCPVSYSIPATGIQNVLYDMRGFKFTFWGKRRIRFIKTPGHGPNACSIILDHNDKQVIFCGDAAYEGGTIWHPYHLEWDHWTGEGALAAWKGLKHLSDVGMDLLCPSHGPVIREDPVSKLTGLTHRLMDFYNTKNSISPGEYDLYLEPQELLIGNKVKKILPSLYQYGNFYLLLSSAGEGMVIDPTMSDLHILTELLNSFQGIKITAATASHYHNDHCDALNLLRSSCNTKIILHPAVAEPLKDVDSSYVPWLPRESIIPDEFWPVSGTWKWNEFTFNISHAPGQTWWHCVFMTNIDGKKVCFTGDSFQPNTRWNGTGGYCAYNGIRFSNGFVPTCKSILEWDPEIIAAGHGSYYHFSRSKFEKIIEWAENTEDTVARLCPESNLLKHYYSLGADYETDIYNQPGISLLQNELCAWYKAK